MSHTGNAYPFSAARFPVDMDALRHQTPYLHHKITSFKPLKDFFNLSKVKAPKSFADWRVRFLVNLQYYQSNYLLIALLVSLIQLIQRPWLLISLALLTSGVVYLRRTETEELRISTLKLDKKYLHAALFLTTIPVILFSSPLATVLSIATISAGIVATHASLLDAQAETSFNETMV